jgi:hypothetical protein
MEKEAIVKKLLSLGVMATPETLKKIETGGLDAFLEKIKKDSCMVIQEDVGDGETGEGVTCCVQETSTKTEMTPDDIVQANGERYKKISNLLLRKMDAVSINNIGRTNTKLSVVGMVKEKTGNGFVLEDGTGEVEVKSSGQVDLDDVIGVRGWLREKTLFGQEIVYPDIPIDRQVNSMDIKVLLSGNGENPTKDADIILTPTTLGDSEGKEKNIPNPAWVFLEKGEKKITILLYKPPQQTGKEEVLAWMKKRYMGKGNVPAMSSEMVMETVPDVFWVVDEGEPWAANYKGVTLVSMGGKHQALLDLNTRKIEMR